MLSIKRNLKAEEPRARAVYVVGALFVATGLVVTASAMANGTWTLALLDAAITGSTVVLVMMFSIISRLERRVREMNQTTTDLNRRFELVELAVEKLGATEPVGLDTQWINLAALGSGDVARLTAATLDRSTFPRLVQAMEKHPPSEPGERASRTISIGDSKIAIGQGAGDVKSKNIGSALPSDVAVPEKEASGAPTTANNFWREWQLGIRTGDLAACRNAYLVLSETADPEMLGTLTTQLKQLEDQTEEDLRRTFHEAVQQGNIASVLETGRRICELLPNRPVAKQFRRVEADLLRRQEEDRQPAPALRVLH